jgi:hypothetical protein
MWTINDFQAYKIISGWSMHGKLACSYCMENSKTFILTDNSKISFFYCHQQSLPTDHKFRKNIKDFFRVKNCMTWCQSMVILCLVFNPVSISFMILI